jgi:2-aminoadipate transaminase
MQYEPYLAERGKDLEGSAIREIFKILAEPGMISFAGGIPAPECFPYRELSEIARDILLNKGVQVLQYGVTEGYTPLREWVTERMRQQGLLKEGDAVIITTGGQQGIDLGAKVLLNEGDGVAVEAPSFVGALNALRSYRARLYGVPLDDDGMDMDALEGTLRAHPHIKLIYVIPTFQNPSGITMSLEKRKKLLALASQYDVLIMEDNPYEEQRFAGEPVPTLKSLDIEGRVLYLGSFSKVLSPGMRVGWACGPATIIQRMTVMKQVNDVHTNLLAQMMILEYDRLYGLDAHVAEVCRTHQEKYRLMLACMDRYLPAERVSWTRPQGGLYIWCTLKDGHDAAELVKRCAERKVAFVPGSAFAIDSAAPNPGFRLNFSAALPEKIEEGIRTLGDVIRTL